MKRWILLVALVACRKPTAGADFFGTHVAPPGVLAKVHEGMSVDELKVAVPDLENDPLRGYLLGRPAKNVELYAIANDGFVTETYVSWDGGDAKDVLTKAWGVPDQEPDRDDQHLLVWRNIESGWRATLFCGHGTTDTPLPPFCTIKFHSHKPLAQLFGKGVGPGGELANVKPDVTFEAFKAQTHIPFRPEFSLSTRWLAYDGAIEHVDFVDGALFRIAYGLPKIARLLIEKAWGPGVVEDKTELWYDATTGWTASLEPQARGDGFDLDFAGYMPFEAEVDLLDKLAAAKTGDEAKRAHPELTWVTAKGDRDTLQLVLPMNELVHPTFRSLRHANVTVFSLTNNTTAWMMGFLDPAKTELVVASFTRRWGKPQITHHEKDYQRTDYRWEGHGTVLAEDSQLTIQLER